MAREVGLPGLEEIPSALYSSTGCAPLARTVSAWRIQRSLSSMIWPFIAFWARHCPVNVNSCFQRICSSRERGGLHCPI